MTVYLHVLHEVVIRTTQVMLILYCLSLLVYTRGLSPHRSTARDNYDLLTSEKFY